MNTPAPPQVEPLTAAEMREGECHFLLGTAQMAWHRRWLKERDVTIAQLQAEIAMLKSEVEYTQSHLASKEAELAEANQPKPAPLTDEQIQWCRDGDIRAAYWLYRVCPETWLATLDALKAENAAWKERVDVLATEIEELRNQPQPAPVGEDVRDGVVKVLFQFISDDDFKTLKRWEVHCEKIATAILAHLTKLGWGKRG